MQQIPMVDLVGQYNKIKPEVDAAIQQILSTAGFIGGPFVKKFQEDLQEYLGVKHVITCANGTDALQVAMMGLGLEPGDEVITTSFTFIATAEVVALLRLKPIVVDVDKDTYCIDPEAVERAITSRTKAIVPVHLFGQCANMDAITDIAHRHNLFVIEDNAQAIGANYRFKDGTVKKSGTIGTIGCTSFFPSKNLGCYGDGGAIFTNDDDLAEMMRIVVNHGMKVRYYHDYIGVNSRLDAIQAAVLDIKLQHLDEYIAARQHVAAYYEAAFAQTDKIITPKTAPFTDHVFHQYVVVLNGIEREKAMAHLQSKGIASAIYYPVPLHMQKAYKDTRYKEGDFPVCEHLCEHVLALPIHTEFTDEQLKYVTESLLELC